jgi:hypothetical protein
MIFLKINKIGKPLPKPKERGTRLINKIGDEKGVITTNTNETQRIVRHTLKTYILIN